MSITAFLSIWISNTAVAAMMIPIVVSLIKNVVKLDPDFQEPKQMETPANIYISNFQILYYLKLFLKTNYFIIKSCQNCTRTNSAKVILYLIKNCLKIKKNIKKKYYQIVR